MANTLSEIELRMKELEEQGLDTYCNAEYWELEAKQRKLLEGEGHE